MSGRETPKRLKTDVDPTRRKEADEEMQRQMQQKYGGQASGMWSNPADPWQQQPRAVIGSGEMQSTQPGYQQTFSVQGQTLQQHQQHMPRVVHQATAQQPGANVTATGIQNVGQQQGQITRVPGATAQIVAPPHMDTAGRVTTADPTYARSGQNKPPGLHDLGKSMSASHGSATSDFSLFSKGQMNPGVIQRPTSSQHKLPTTDTPPQVVVQHEPQRDYSHDLGLSQLGMPKVEQRSMSERHLPTGQSTKDLMSAEFKPQVYQADKEKQQQEQLKQQMQQQHQQQQQQQMLHQQQQQQPNLLQDQPIHHVFDSNTIHSVLLAIPSLGKGFEHLLGNTPKIGNMIKFFNDQGFMRAVPFQMPGIATRDEGSGSSGKGSVHESKTSLTSTTSSTHLLTSSQRDVFGIEADSKWPLGSARSIDDRSETASIMDLDREEEMLVRRLEKVRMERVTRQQQEARDTYELERTCKKKMYFRDDDKRSDGASGTVV